MTIHWYELLTAFSGPVLGSLANTLHHHVVNQSPPQGRADKVGTVAQEEAEKPGDAPVLLKLHDGVGMVSAPTGTVS